MPDDLSTLKARVSEAIRLAESPDYRAQRVAAIRLRQEADRIENSAIWRELDDFEAGAISER